MKPETALRHFKTREAIQVAAGVTKQAVSQWFTTGVIPRRSAAMLELKSGGAVVVDPAVYRRLQAQPGGGHAGGTNAGPGTR